jgi:hypothetical protein
VKFVCPNGHTWKSQRFKPEPWERLCPEPGCGRSAEPSLKTRSTAPGKLHQESIEEQQARARFHQLVCEWPCWARARRPGHQCFGPLDPHHLVPADWIRHTYGDLPEAGLLRILFNPIIGAPLCRGFHAAVEDRNEFIYWHELDDELKEFAKYVDELYPDRGSMLNRLKLESPDPPPNPTEAAPAAPVRSSE